jgi:hypothetical protein
MFSTLKDGEVAATAFMSRKNSIKAILGRAPRRHWEIAGRYWELAGCITCSASRSMFENGCGLWADFAFHVNCPNKYEYMKRMEAHWDHGSGILYWELYTKKDIHKIPERKLKRFHFTRIGNPQFKELALENGFRNSGADLAHNYVLADCLDLVGLDRKVYLP